MKQNFKWNKSLIARIIAVIIAVILMGAALSVLFLFDMGADPFTVMNRSASRRIGWTFGNWQLLINVILFIIVIIWGRKYIGIGTLANMILVGYSADLFSYILKQCGVTSLSFQSFSQILVFILALLLFLVSAAVYMDVNLGGAPYDALSFVLRDRLPKIPFRILRISYDVIVVIIGILCGAKLQLVTLLMALLLGPAVEYTGKIGAKFFPAILGDKED